MDPITLLTAFVPMITDGARGLINKFTGGDGAKPANAEEAIKLIDADIRKLEAIAKLDGGNENTSQWVSNVRALQRPCAALLIVLTWIGVTFSSVVNAEVAMIVSNLAASVVFYLFGDRTYMHFKKDK